VVGGKLFFLGGGWNIAVDRTPRPMSMALAIVMSVPWTATNELHKFTASLLTEDGQLVTAPDGKQVEIKGDFEVGRPPRIKPGTSFNAPLAFQLAMPMSPGAYRWELSVDGSVMAEESFTITPAPKTPLPPQGGAS
jgi:hypothetical protein